MPSFADDHDGFVLPNARFNPSAQPPSGSGLLTPPESPKSSKATLPTPISTRCFASTQHQQLPQYHDSPQSFRFGPSEPEPQSAQHDLSHASETIYTIIEQVIEQKLAEAMGPLRLNIRRFDSENTDLDCQVGRLEQQIDAQLRTLQNISVATSNHLEIISALANQLSNTTNSMQRANGLYDQRVLSRPASSASHQHERHSNIQPQFCFKSRSSKKHRQSQMKSRKPRLVSYMMSKWRAGGARD